MTTAIFRSILPSEDHDELSDSYDDDTTDESDENTEEKP